MISSGFIHQAFQIYERKHGFIFKSKENSILSQDKQIFNFGYVVPII